MSLPTPTGTQDARAPRRPGLLKAALVTSLVVASLVLLVVLAWGADQVVTSGKVARGTVLAGEHIAGQDRTALDRSVRALDADVQGRAVTIVTPKGTVKLTAGQLGVSVDVRRTAGDAMDVGRAEPFLTRPTDWLRAVVGSRRAPITYRVNRTVLAARTKALLDRSSQPATEPTITATSAGWKAVPGKAGLVVDVPLVTEALTDQLTTTPGPYTLDLHPVEHRPTVPDTAAKDLATQANQLTSTPLALRLDGHSITATPAVLRTWFQPVVKDRTLALDLRPKTVNAWLASSYRDLSTPATDARFDIGFTITIHPSATGRACCAADSPTLIRQSLEAGRHEVTLSFRVVQPRLTTERAKGLGIKEPVSTFTTPHQCCQARVQNIHRIADIVRGAVILPGETFSVNGYVGQRTRAKGFTTAPVIYYGSDSTDVGGGVSQFATTTFNAAFFAGLAIPEYQSHSLYISRYPYGREATISWPKPDLKIENISPYGILVWPTYTGTSLTVTFFSTKWVDVTQSAQTRRPVSHGCTRVTTQRTREFMSAAEAQRVRGAPPAAGSDPRAVVDDVYALYQPAEGVLC